MRASECIALLQKKCKGEDPEIVFKSYEWDDDLENMSFQNRELESVSKKKSELVIKLDRQAKKGE